MRSFKGTNTKKRTRPVSDEDDNEDEGNPNKRIAGVDNASIVTNMITDIVSNNTNDNTTDSSESSELYDNLSNIITTSQTSPTTPTALGKVKTFIDDLNDEMTQSDAKLTKEQVLELSERVNEIIRNKYLVQEISNQIGEEPSGEIIKQVFHGLIEYYVAMGYYAREKAPGVLTKMGALLAGSAIVGASIHQTFNIASASSSSGNTLIALARYLTPVTAFGSGLYLLGEGGLDISEKAVSCVQGVQEGCVKLVNFASDALHDLLESDDWSAPSSPSSASSASSASSVLSNASNQIEALLNKAEQADKVEEFMENLSQSQGSVADRSQSQGSEISAITDSQVSNATLGDGDDEIYSMPSDNTQTKGGKSRRHTKFRKTKRRVKKNHRLTKKGKKHYKTLKRYRRKMRR